MKQRDTEWTWERLLEKPADGHTSEIWEGELSDVTPTPESAPLTSDLPGTFGMCL